VTGYFPRIARGVHSYPVDDSAAKADVLGLGVVGLGEGRTALMASLRTRNVRPVMGCDLDEQLISAARSDFPDVDYTTDFDAMLANPAVDVVGIYTPDPVHARQIVAALDAGKHVVCTKPVVDGLDSAAAVLEAARRNSGKLIVGQSTRFFESFRRQRRGFETGGVGRLEVVEAHYTHRMDWYYADRPWVARDADWIFLGMSHPIDLVSWYLGPIERVSAFGMRSQLAEDAGGKSFDVVTANMMDAQGRIGRVFGHYGMHELPRARNSIECMLYGTAGTSLAKYHDMEYLYTGEDGVEHVEDALYEYRHYHFNNEVHGMHYGEFANYLQYFAEAILEEKEYSPGLEEALRTLCVMEATRISAVDGGSPVAVGPLAESIGLP
jgi:predicted dehydrogenase